MPQTHVVTNNDHISKLAALYGYQAWETLWEANGTLSANRKNPHILFHGDQSGAPGDTVQTAPPTPKQVGGATDAHHPNKTGKPKLYLPIRVLDEKLQPLKKAKCKLLVDGIDMKVDELDDSGALKVEIPKTAQNGQLVVELPPSGAAAKSTAPSTGTPAPAPKKPKPIEVKFNLEIGRLNPIQEQAPDDKCIAGAQQRLNNLGFDAGHVDGLCGDATQAALKRFQTRFGITEADPQGKPMSGPQTQAALFKYHDQPTAIPAPGAATSTGATTSSTTAPPPSTPSQTGTGTGTGTASPSSTTPTAPSTRPLPPLPTGTRTGTASPSSTTPPPRPPP